MAITTVGRVAFVAATIALTAGCAGTSVPASSPNDAGGAQAQAVQLALPAPFRDAGPNAVDAYVWVSDSSGFVYKYSQAGTNQSPLVTISNGLNAPHGLAVDKADDVYVANSGDNNILEFDRFGTLLQTYADSDFSPTSVAVCPDGTVYAGNPGANSSVSVYAGGSSSPTSSLLIGGFGVVGLACDRAANLYVAFLHKSAGPGGVLEYRPGGKGSPKTLPVTTKFPHGIAVSRAGLIVIADEFDGVLFFTSQGKQVRSLTGFTDPMNVAFTRSATKLYVTDPGAHPQAAVEVSAGNGEVLDRIAKPAFHGVFGVAAFLPDSL